MIVEKVINNNIVSSIDDKGRETVIMGRGIGFQYKSGQEIDHSKIEKIFIMENNEASEHLQELLADIPIEQIEVSNEIIAYAKTVIHNKLSKNIYITLTDHINFTVKRYQEGIHFTNALLWEIKRLYHQEFQVGQKAAELLYQKLHIAISEDEAASIAMHFVNAELGTEMPNTIDITKLIQNVLKIITYSYKKEIIEESINYERFITHLRFFSQRVINNQINKSKDEPFYEMIKVQYPAAYACAEKINRYVEKEYHVTLPQEEIVYLAVHINRIMSDEVDNGI